MRLASPGSIPFDFCIQLWAEATGTCVCSNSFAVQCCGNRKEGRIENVSVVHPVFCTSAPRVHGQGILWEKHSDCAFISSFMYLYSVLGVYIMIGNLTATAVYISSHCAQHRANYTVQAAPDQINTVSSGLFVS